MAATPLPSFHRALVQQEYGKPLQVLSRSTPKPTPGSAIVKVSAATVLSYMGGIYDGSRNYAYPTPLVAGFSAVGRVAAVGNDSSSLDPGQLVYVDSVIRGRDDPSAIFLFGIAEGGSEASRKLMCGEWRDSTYAEYAKMPLENCIPLNEAVLCNPPTDGGLAYQLERLAYLGVLLVPLGGLRDIRLAKRSSSLLRPAHSEVRPCLWLSQSELARIETVEITGNIDEEVAALHQLGGADALLDISPPEASKSSHIKSGILALGQGGRASLMAGYLDDVSIPYRAIMRKNIQLRGKWMYTREDILRLVQMVETGVLGLRDEDGLSFHGSYSLEEWREAFDQAKKKSLAGQIVVLRS